MPGHRLAKVVTSSIGALCLIEGYYGYEIALLEVITSLKYRDYMMEIYRNNDLDF